MEIRKRMSDSNIGIQKYGKVLFADPINNKYPIDTEKHIRAAWAYIHIPRNAAKYSPDEVEIIKNAIRKESKKYNINLVASLISSAIKLLQKR